MTDIDVSVLLDTNALIYLANDMPFRDEAMQALASSANQRRLFVSPVSAWEVGNISRPSNRRRSIDFLPDATIWFRDVMTGLDARLTPLTVEIGIAAAYLPDGLNADPADRLLTATARAIGATLITRDRDILAYAALGHVRAIAC
ncbi:tRNA(fMet)-specific endonuclease VapC [Brevundimonas sp. NIBR10]|uniref:type II toxin-antitoxin system VapC family toxin n=1 Tax=Brevundimonas sp. NIBR10 TaxID=3015997 RepID=UPI0022F1A35F|nr:type II toxin-antitoxin system VapC family toxin [Brevundimonas sp. NIBR10]WGM48694.1 tRNA(fMet)-specific endonuclease VapC [Brevundimonas sp. NIBR10]